MILAIIKGIQHRILRALALDFEAEAVWLTGKVDVIHAARAATTEIRHITKRWNVKSHQKSMLKTSARDSAALKNI